MRTNTAKVFLNRYLWRKIIEFSGLNDDYKYQIIYEIIFSICSVLEDDRFTEEIMNDIISMISMTVVYEGKDNIFTLPLDIKKIYYYIINEFYTTARYYFLDIYELSEGTYDYDDGIMYFTPPVIELSLDIRYRYMEEINKSENIYNIFNIILNNKININFWLHFLSLDKEQLNLKV